MFKSIKLKLVMINVAVVGIILLLYSAEIYWHQMQEYAARSHEVMRMIASDATSGTARPVKRPGRWFNYFYVKTDSQGNIVDTSPDPSISPDRLKALVKQSMELPETSGEIMLACGQSFRFLNPPRVKVKIWFWFLLTRRWRLEVRGIVFLPPFLLSGSEPSPWFFSAAFL